MDVEVVGTDLFGVDAYKALFEEVMSDIGKAALIDRAHIVLKPEVPLFIFSIKLRADPSNKTIADTAEVRAEGDSVHITITDERYAPDILSEMWKRYGRDAVYQQTRFDLNVDNAVANDVKSVVVASGEDSLRELIGALWRAMPEGIKNRRTLVDGTTITIIATEEILLPEMLKEGNEVHKMMKEAKSDV